MSNSDAAAQHMDGIYRYQRYIYDASRKYYLLGRDRLLDEMEVPAGGTVLEVACGTGRNLIRAARRYPNARLYGFDVSNEMLATARSSIARAGLSDRIVVAYGDATDFACDDIFGVPAFDRVIVSYALSMIPHWRGALEQAATAVAPGGALYVVDFGDQEGLPRWFKKGLHAWLAKFSVRPRQELETELAQLARRRGLTAYNKRLYRGYATYAVVTRQPGTVSAQVAI